MATIQLEEIENCKNITNDKLHKEVIKLVKYDTSTNKTSFAGNPIIYHFFFKELLKCKRQIKNKEYINFYDIWNNEDKKNKLVEQTIKRDRRGKGVVSPVDIYECFRINLGSIVFFKPTNMKYICDTYLLENSKVLDLTMGWSGRFLGSAFSKNVIEYVGYDSNKSLEKCYDELSDFILVETPLNCWKFHFKDCFECKNDYEEGYFDCMISSPPYINTELYENMNEFKSENEYYRKFLIPYFELCKLMVKKDGLIMINISQKIYDTFINTYKMKKCDCKEPLKQQMGQNNKKQDFVYIWFNN